MSTIQVLVALLSPIVAVIIAAWGFRRSRRTDMLGQFFDVYDKYLTEQVRKGRRIIHASAGGVGLSPGDASAVGYTLAVMNSIAVCCESKYVDVDLIAKSMGRSFCSAMDAAAPIIDSMSAERGFRPYGYAERLAARLRDEYNVGNR